MGSNIEAVWIGVHNVNAWATRFSIRCTIFRVALVVDSDGVDTGDTTAIDCAEVHSVFHSTSAKVRLEPSLSSFCVFIFDSE